MARAFYFNAENRENVLACTGNAYCPDTVRFLLPAIRRVDAFSSKETTRSKIPIALQYGDSDIRGVFDP